jgi:hypothetical protein
MNQSMFDKLRPGTPDCPSELALDKWICDGLSDAEQRFIAVHVSDCEVCVERIELRRMGLSAFPLLDEEQQLAALKRRLAKAPTTGPLPLLPCESMSQRNPVE